MIILLHMYRIIGDGPGWFTTQFATWKLNVQHGLTILGWAVNDDCIQ